MRTSANPGIPVPAKRLQKARRKTMKVRDQLQVAGGELQLTKSVIEQGLPQEAANGDVSRALAQQGAIEEKVMEAADELATVHGLLDEEVAERERLEQELERATQQSVGTRS